VSARWAAWRRIVGPRIRRWAAARERVPRALAASADALAALLPAGQSVLLRFHGLLDAARRVGFRTRVYVIAAGRVLGRGVRAAVPRAGRHLGRAGERAVHEALEAGGWIAAHALPIARRTGDAAGRGFDVCTRWLGAALPRLAPAIGRAGHDAGVGLARLGTTLATRGAQLRLGWVHMALGAMIAGMVVWLPYETCGFAGCPDVEKLLVYQPGGAPAILDRNGVHFADLAPFERSVITLEDLPGHVPAAFIAVEDKRFYRHNGVDWLRVLGAALANLREGRVTQGSSTLSMQLARSVFPEEVPGTERTLRRKLLEVRLAREIERKFSKAEILELYLNHVYLGGGAYGIEAAARRHFGKPAAELTLAEAASIAGLARSPAYYDPRRNPETSRQRRDLVLSMMAEQGLAAREDVDAALAAALEVPADPPRDRSAVPLGAWFVDIVRDRVEAEFGEQIYRSGIRIHTTLDVTAQQAAERELEERLQALDKQVRPGPGPLQGAVVLMEAPTGDVLALVGGRDPTISRYNRATLGRRQVGSAFKPFVYAAAIEHGYVPAQRIMDWPVRVQVSANDVWTPGNYDGRYEGPVSVRNALVRSRNVPTVRLAADIGLQAIVRTARAAGITAPIDPTPALALGTPSLSPMEMASAYATFATLGTPATPHYVTRVEDENGEVLWEPAREPSSRTMSSAVAYVVTDMLRDVVDRGTGTGVRAAGFRGVAAGKTGTTNDATDAWFVGYTPDVVGAVWIGYDQPSSMGNAATGGGYAAPVWGGIMRELYTVRSAPGEWARPDSVRAAAIDPESGMLLAEGCSAPGGTVTDLYIVGREPGTICPSRGWWGDIWAGVGRLLGRPAPQ